MLIFKCHYCPATFPDFINLVKHFLAKHCNGEYIEIEVPVNGTPI
jgi:hypothetical protein